MMEATNEHQAGWPRPLYERQVAMLGELAEAGLEIALDIKDHIKAATELSVKEAGALAYGRAARAVRLSLLLQADLVRQMWDMERSISGQASSMRIQGKFSQKARVAGVVERVATREGQHRDGVERLVRETGDRLDQEDVIGDIRSRPVSELVAMICKDLGLDPDWSVLAQEAWAVEEMRSGEVGWPLSDGLHRQISHLDDPSPHAGEGVSLGLTDEGAHQRSPPPSVDKDVH